MEKSRGNFYTFFLPSRSINIIGESNLGERLTGRKFGFLRPIFKEVVERYLDCGNPRYGLARIRCPDCGEERLLMFSRRAEEDVQSLLVFFAVRFYNLMDLFDDFWMQRFSRMEWNNDSCFGPYVYPMAAFASEKPKAGSVKVSI